MPKSENIPRVKAPRTPAPSPRAENATSSDPYGSEIEKAQRMLEELRLKKEQQQKQEEHQRVIQESRNDFKSRKVKVIEKLTEAVPKIEHILANSKQEMQDLEQAKKHLLTNLKGLESINPDRWGDQEVANQIDKHQAVLSKAARDYDHFAAAISDNKKGGSLKNMTTSLPQAGHFSKDFTRGFAFSLPLIITAFILFFISQ